MYPDHLRALLVSLTDARVLAELMDHVLGVIKNVVHKLIAPDTHLVASLIIEILLPLFIDALKMSLGCLNLPS